MLFGHKPEFAIECYHEAIPGHESWVFGRMCLYIQGSVLGDIDEPACALCVTQGHLQDVIKLLSMDPCEHLCDMADTSLFKFLDQKLFLDDDRSLDQVALDATMFSQYIFLTNGGESFDGFKSFIVPCGDHVRFLWDDRANNLYAGKVNNFLVRKTFNDWLQWFTVESQTPARALRDPPPLTSH